MARSRSRNLLAGRYDYRASGGIAHEITVADLRGAHAIATGNLLITPPGRQHAGTARSNCTAHGNWMSVSRPHSAPLSPRCASHRRTRCNARAQRDGILRGASVANDAPLVGTRRNARRATMEGGDGRAGVKRP